MWFVYLLECKDGTLYTGITTDVERRVEMHRNCKGSKYVAARGVRKLLFALSGFSHSQAARLEHRIKQLEPYEKLSFFSVHDQLCYSAFD